ncbi:MFS multidrug transporter [Penicillium capsulatum]|uniref:MFS multidrug transporter n=1 Tax=Penicillium capsulatum TaxID=69766 RepID=A0A9W9IL46_9EURO|nr:MFS multidrug transporter [Penicillium capsulatum]KAJ6122083.1 MFS multidrug transporter [Penicillium capsulatum]
MIPGELPSHVASDGRNLSSTVIHANDYTFHGMRHTEKNDPTLDLEGNPSSIDTGTPQNPEDGKNAKLVAWDSPNDPGNPQNWPMRRKWLATVLVSCFTFISPVSSSMIAPTVSNIAVDFGITDEIVSELTLSTFVLAYAVGPLVLAPLSEIYGRKIVLQMTNLFYITFNVACGVSRSTGQLIAFRFLSGLGGSAPLAIGGAVLGDCFQPEQRGKALAIYGLAPLLGPAVGPIAGGFIAENTTWRWVFYSTSIAAGFIQILGLFFLPETHAPTLLKHRARQLRRVTEDLAYQSHAEGPSKSTGEVLCTSFYRPFRMLATQPIVQILALYMAYVYGTMYLTLATFPTLWTSPEYYGQSQGIAGLNYISMGLGFLLGSQICAPLIDRIYCRLKHRNGGVGRPEFRVPLLAVAAFCMPVGLFIYGWTAQTRCHWIAPNIGICIFSIGCIVAFQSIQAYIVDSYTRYAASALAAAACLRSLAGFSFPLFAPYMFKALAYGWGNSVLALASIGIGLPAPILLWRFGEQARRASPFASG